MKEALEEQIMQMNQRAGEEYAAAMDRESHRIFGLEAL